MSAGNGGVRLKLGDGKFATDAHGFTRMGHVKSSCLEVVERFKGGHGLDWGLSVP